MRVGQRVKCEYGEGTVLGFERFNNGYTIDSSTVDDDTDARVLVTLDEPERWSLYFARTELEEL